MTSATKALAYALGGAALLLVALFALAVYGIRDEGGGVSDHVMVCGICRQPLTACFNKTSNVAWAECFAGGHDFIQNIFTPADPARFEDDVAKGVSFLKPIEVATGGNP